MDSFSEELIKEVTNAEDVLREIQTERMIYQINSTSDARKTSDKMKKDIEKIIKAMENARSIVYEKKNATDEMKVNLSGKKDKIKKLQQELDHTEKRVESIAKRTSDLKIETNKIKAAIEKIEEATLELNSKYLEQSQNELINSLVKVTSEAEKAQSDLNTAKRMETISSKKLQDMEIDFNKSQSYTFDKIQEIERIVANVSITIEHIIKSYDEITVISKDLLKSATVTQLEVEKTLNQEFEQNVPHQEFKVAI